MSKTPSLALIGANLVMLFVAAYRSWGYEYILAMLWWETVLAVDWGTHRYEHR